MEGPYRPVLKILLVGPEGVGKTSLAQRFECKYDESMAPAPTVGVNFTVHTKQASDGVNYTVHLFDTAGAPRFASIVQCYYRDACAILAVVSLPALEFDVAGVDDATCAQIVRERHLAGLHRALLTYDLSRRDPPVLYIMGNKSDMVADVPLETLRGRTELMTQAAALHAIYLDCSARNNINATDSINKLIDALVAEDTTRRQRVQETAVIRPLAPEWARIPWTERLTASSDIGSISCWCCYAS